MHFASYRRGASSSGVPHLSAGADAPRLLTASSADASAISIGVTASSSAARPVKPSRRGGGAGPSPTVRFALAAAVVIALLNLASVINSGGSGGSDGGRRKRPDAVEGGGLSSGADVIRRDAAPVAPVEPQQQPHQQRTTTMDIRTENKLDGTLSESAGDTDVTTQLESSSGRRVLDTVVGEAKRAADYYYATVPTVDGRDRDAAMAALSPTNGRISASASLIDMDAVATTTSSIADGVPVAASSQGAKDEVHVASATIDEDVVVPDGTTTEFATSSDAASAVASFARASAAPPVDSSQRADNVNPLRPLTIPSSVVIIDGIADGSGTASPTSPTIRVGGAGRLATAAGTLLSTILRGGVRRATAGRRADIVIPPALRTDEGFHPAGAAAAAMEGALAGASADAEGEGVFDPHADGNEGFFADLQPADFLVGTFFSPIGKFSYFSRCNYGAYMHANRVAYAAAHGYQYDVDTVVRDPSRPLPWQKVSQSTLISFRVFVDGWLKEG